MDIDMEVACGTEDYEELQEYFEHRKFDFVAGEESQTKRLRQEYVPDVWELEVLNEKNKVDYRREAIKRILARMAQVSSDSESIPIEKTEGKR